MDKLSKLLEMEERGKVSKSKSGMTRHSRFGTTVTVKAVSLPVLPQVCDIELIFQGDRKLVLHKQNAITVDPGQMLDEIKRKRAGKLKKAVSSDVIMGNCNQADDRRMSFLDLLS